MSEVLLDGQVVEFSNQFHEDIVKMLARSNEIRRKEKGFDFGHSKFAWRIEPRTDADGLAASKHRYVLEGIVHQMDVSSAKIDPEISNIEGLMQYRALGAVSLAKNVTYRSQSGIVAESSEISLGLKLRQDPRTGLITYVPEYRHKEAQEFTPFDRRANKSNSATVNSDQGEPIVPDYEFLTDFYSDLITMVHEGIDKGAPIGPRR